MSEHPRGRAVGWVVLALAGLAVAVALSVAASNLSTQPIGLSGEPLRAGDKLAPAQVTERETTAAPTPRKPRTQTTTAAVRTEITPSVSTRGNEGPGDDHGGRDSDHDDD